MTLPDPFAPAPSPAGRRRAMDAAVIVCAIGFGLFMLAPTASAHSRPALIADVVLGAAACAALVCRRRRPVAVAAFAVAASAVSACAAGASLVALFSAAVRVRPAILAALTAAELVAVFCFPLLYPGAGGFGYAAQVTIGGLLNLAVVGWGLMVRAQRAHLAAVEARARDLEAGQEILAATVRDQERRRIAGEMHDALAHRLSLLSVHAGALELRTDLGPGQIAEMAGVIRQTSHDALEDLHEVIGLLRETPGADDSLLTPGRGLGDVAGLVDQARRAGAQVALDSRVTGSGAGPRGRAAAATAYRIVQEGLTNARKHAPDSPVEVTVRSDGPETIMVTVTTTLTAAPRPGPGAAPARAIPGAGSGLQGLAERVSLLGGTLTAGPVGDRFVVAGRLPWTR